MPCGRARTWSPVVVATTVGLSSACLSAPPSAMPARLNAVVVEGPAPMPRPYRRRGEDAVALNATCVSCHLDEAAEWRASRHRAAYDNAAFRAALAVEPTYFCAGCHAPEASSPTTSTKPGHDDTLSLGVGCVTCHVTEPGIVLAAPARDGRASPAPHRIRRDAELARTSGCAGCHEFTFPSATSNDDTHMMQTTVREHARSPAAADACADCHMPKVGQRRSHAFAETRDPSWLKAQLEVHAERIDGLGARLTLVQTSPGHAFPTGDLFRRLEVGIELRASDGTVLGRQVRHLARHFETVPGLPARTLVADDRVFETPTIVDLRLPAASSTARGDLVWWVTYQRVAEIGSGARPADATIESAIQLRSGKLVWEARQ